MDDGHSRTSQLHAPHWSNGRLARGEQGDGQVTSVVFGRLVLGSEEALSDEWPGSRPLAGKENPFQVT